MTRLLASGLMLVAAMALLSAATAEGIDVRTGEIDGAPFRIQVPPSWNGGLVLYTHGYLVAGAPWFPLHETFGRVFLERRFALAESGYSRQGWAVAEALRETEALRIHFAEQFGEPDTTFVTGHSMGGLIALATLESHPDAYAGALPMCGPLTPALRFLTDQVFDMLVTFDALFGDSLPASVRPVVDAAELPAATVEHVLSSDSTRAARFAQHWDTRLGDLPQSLSFYHLFYREIVDRAGGHPCDNQNTIYSGFGPFPDLNERVPRYAAIPEAAAYLHRHYTPTGEIHAPVLAVHTTYDPGVAPWMPNSYTLTATLHGNQRWFVQHHVRADGHCNIAPMLMAKAFDQLRAWAARRIRPSPGWLY